MQQVCGKQIAKPDFWTTRLPIRQTYTLVCPLSYRPRGWDIFVKRRIGDPHSIRNLFYREVAIANKRLRSGNVLLRHRPGPSAYPTPNLCSKKSRNRPFPDDALFELS